MPSESFPLLAVDSVLSRRQLPIADRIKVRRPCPTAGAVDKGTLWCSTCQTQVVDTSALTRAEVEELFEDHRRSDARLCIRTYVRRSDGATLLADGFVLPEAKATRPVTTALTALAAATLAACTSTSEVTSSSADSSSAPTVATAPVAVNKPRVSVPAEPSAAPTESRDAESPRAEASPPAPVAKVAKPTSSARAQTQKPVVTKPPIKQLDDVYGWWSKD